jgi:hypothetical protein
MPLEPASGLAAVDHYLEHGYDSVRGMSSRFSAAICAWLLEHQRLNGVRGPIAEIGTFEGRYFIALALALAEGEKALGIDTFDWPNDKVEALFASHCSAHGVPEDRVISWKTDSRSITPDALRSRIGNAPVRFFHIDGEHSAEALGHDLALATAVMHPHGLLCLDDMLHPGYPFLVSAVQAYLESHPDMRLMCIIDREDIVAAAKFLLCRVEAVALYENALMERFKPQHFVLGGDALGHFCVVLTPAPRLAEVD